MVDLKSFDLNLLVALDALIAEASVSGAARRVGIGQPAMSHALARLRDVFGDPLLVRAGAVMRPTTRALDLAGPVARILDDIRCNVIAGTVFRPAEEERVFRFSASDYVMTAVLPHLLATLQNTAPKVQVVTRLLGREEIVPKLSDGTVELAVGYFPDRGPLLSETLFREEHVCLFDSAACGMAAPLSLDDYLSVPHFLVTSQADLTGIIDTELAKLGRTRFVQMSTSSFLAIPFLLRGARAAAVVPSRLARHCREAIGLSASSLPVPVAGFDVSMVWSARTDADPAHRWFRDRVRDAAAKDEPGL